METVLVVQSLENERQRRELECPWNLRHAFTFILSGGQGMSEPLCTSMSIKAARFKPLKIGLVATEAQDLVWIR